MPSKLSLFFRELKRRKVTRVAVVYASFDEFVRPKG